MTNFNNVKISNFNNISENEKKLEFKKLIDTIDLHQNEAYDCTNLNVWSYRKAGDIRDGVSLKFGNMVKGFPFEVGGVMFNHSEGAYIAGLYSSNDADSIRIQTLLSSDRNGLWCKKTYRNLTKYNQFGRKDFYNFNVQWMMYVLWLKSIQSEDFANLLRSLPINCHVVENTTYHRGESATFWGAKNILLESERKVKSKEIATYGVYKKKLSLQQAQMRAVNSINDIGFFEGKNVMGKIIKIMSLSMLYRQEPPIDYHFLESQGLYMLGDPIKFQ